MANHQRGGQAKSLSKQTQEEWQEWLKWSSCKAIYPQPGEVDPKLILKSRICYRWKPKDGGEWFKPKSRIVVLGFADSTTAESRCSSPGKDIPWSSSFNGRHLLEFLYGMVTASLLSCRGSQTMRGQLRFSCDHRKMA